jgi:hypothetical protein
VVSGEAVAKHAASSVFGLDVSSLILHCSLAGVISFVKTLTSLSAITFVAVSMLAGTALAGPLTKNTSEDQGKVEEVAIFVTGSLIPQRVKLRPIDTTTVSPIRIIDRREIDQTGRQTTPGAFVNDPSVRIIGH